MASLNDVTPGSSADSSCIQQVVDVLKGTVGKGVPVSLTDASDAANWALDVTNKEAVNSRAFRASRANGTVLIQADVNGVQVSATGGAPATVVSVNDIQTLTNKSMSLLATSSNNTQVPQCKVYSAVAQTILSGNSSGISWDTEAWDNDNLHSTAANSSRLTPSRPGLWHILGQAVIAANATLPVGAMDLSIQITGNGLAFSRTVSFSTTLGPSVQVSLDQQMSTSDYAVLVINNQTGQTMTLSSNSIGGSFFSMNFVGTT